MSGGIYMIKKIIQSLMIGFMFLSVYSIHSFAYQPASHYVLQERVSDELNDNSIIKRALHRYPEIAAWGANAPDLGYLQPRTVLGYAPWADRYHYYKVGTMAEQLLKDALTTNDLKKIAFAAGWITHITGDLGCHGTFVNREAGVYFENPDGHDLHKELEKNAEPFVWVNLGHHNINDYKNLNKKFSSKDAIPYDLLINATKKVYGFSPSKSDIKEWASLLQVGLTTGIGYSYGDYNKSVEYLSHNNRQTVLENSFNYALDYAKQLLTTAEKGDYSLFTDRWNLDVAPTTNPISTLTAIIDTGKSFGAGTDDDIFFGMIVNVNGHEEKLEWLLDKPGYNDFENGDRDEYYLYMNRQDIYPENVKSIYLKKVDNGTAGGDWQLKKLNVNINGKTASDLLINQWITDRNDTWSSNVKWISNELNVQ